uniref:Uncharacterized protein n=1 Tax=Human herpesvirus 2 TaxID=10310 RepID=A0A481TPF8_HHV2|nr:hypothetical protein [Human alphaherpesvirus 2]QBH82777.1 hypothetical protein [Human alphaherpesvirus 2]QBH82918.1 hypothetical protein [Human alphaherpesvirus 2]QBH83651.1 hypothetical protein [Human alphaherpesvirus 2]
MVAGAMAWRPTPSSRPRASRNATGHSARGRLPLTTRQVAWIAPGPAGGTSPPGSSTSATPAKKSNAGCSSRARLALSGCMNCSAVIWHSATHRTRPWARRCRQAFRKRCCMSAPGPAGAATYAPYGFAASTGSWFTPPTAASMFMSEG